jgi:hypothetical protein
MKDKQSPVNNKEQMEAENDFLKMKLMLEKGAHFSESKSDDLPPEIENFFLKNVIEFEKQFENRKMILIRDKLGNPDHFKPHLGIPDDEIELAWGILSDHLEKNGISLASCSPKVTSRELYRFTTEELFNKEMDDVNVPGLMHCFIYDEFYPDLSYDLSRLAKEHCIRRIFSKEPLGELIFFIDQNIRLNDRYPMTTAEFQQIINRFKGSYEDLEIIELESEECLLGEIDCVVTGKYCLSAFTGLDRSNLSGGWKTVLRFSETFEDWQIHEVYIESINF